MATADARRARRKQVLTFTKAEMDMDRSKLGPGCRVKKNTPTLINVVTTLEPSPLGPRCYNFSGTCGTILLTSSKRGVWKVRAKIQQIPGLPLVDESLFEVGCATEHLLRATGSREPVSLKNNKGFTVRCHYSLKDQKFWFWAENGRFIFAPEKTLCLEDREELEICFEFHFDGPESTMTVSHEDGGVLWKGGVDLTFPLRPFFCVASVDVCKRRVSLEVEPD